MAISRTDTIIERLRAAGDPASLAGMARFGIATDHALGVRVPLLRGIAREMGRDHALALELWTSGYHEARILASMVAEPAQLTMKQAMAWARDFASWDLCDQCCINLFRKTPFAHELIEKWHKARGPYVRRAAFALMATLAVHDKKAPNATFTAWLPLIESAADDPDNAVKKGVSWALRQIGKRNAKLNGEAVSCAERIAKRDTPPARWVASDVLRELTSTAVKTRLGLP